MIEGNMVKNNHEENDKYLTPDLILTIRRFLTKQMVRILLLLLKQDMTNKEMAENMELSSNALSNILQRMKKCEVTLLTMEKRDKYLLYSLTPIAREYTQKFYTVRGADDFKIVHINENETVEFINCRSALDKLKEKLGDEWDVEFPRHCILHYENSKRDRMPESDLFFETLEMLIFKEQFLQVEYIMNELGDGTSRKTCMKYINKYMHIKRLCLLDAENWKMAYQFIDDLFSREQICISYDFLRNCGDLSKEDILDMVNVLVEIINDSKERKLTKGEFFDVWSKYFGPHQQLIYYVAEKYRNKYSAD